MPTVGFGKVVLLCSRHVIKYETLAANILVLPGNFNLNRRQRGGCDYVAVDMAQQFVLNTSNSA